MFVPVLTVALGVDVGIVLGAVLTSALMSGDWIAGVSETTGTFALGVGVATFFPQPVRSSAMAAASSTALRSTFFICIPPKSELYLFACIVCPAVPANMTKHARFFDNAFKR